MDFIRNCFSLINKQLHFNTIAVTLASFALSGCNQENSKDDTKMWTSPSCEIELSEEAEPSPIAIETCQPLCYGVNPPARPLVECGQNLFVQASALYWQATQSGLNYALNWTNGHNVSITDFNNSGSGRFKHPDFDWDWGFKLAAGYDTPHDGWDLFLQWTWFHPKKMHSSTNVQEFTNADTTPSGVVYPLLLPSGIGNLGPGFGASMNWKLRLDLLDLELGREFFVSNWLTLRPHAGLRSAWLHQRSHVEYSGLTALVGSGLIVVLPQQIPTTEASLKNNFWGMGPRIGLDGQWGLGCNWSLYSDLAASLLLGHFSIFEIESPVLDSSGTILTGSSTSFSERFRATRAAFDLDLGVRYEQLFSCDRYGLMVQLGWEQHLFINQNQLTRLATSMGYSPSTANTRAFTPVSNQGDLSTQGVTLTVEFDF